MCPNRPVERRRLHAPLVEAFLERVQPHSKTGRCPPLRSKSSLCTTITVILRVSQLARVPGIFERFDGSLAPETIFANGNNPTWGYMLRSIHTFANRGLFFPVMHNYLTIIFQNIKPYSYWTSHLMDGLIQTVGRPRGLQLSQKPSINVSA